jgi:hypothetical protein
MGHAGRGGLQGRPRPQGPRRQLVLSYFFKPKAPDPRGERHERRLRRRHRHDQVRAVSRPKTVPQLGAEAALLALDDCGLKIQDMEALYCGNLGQAERHGRPAHPAADRPDRHSRGQLRQRLRHRRHRVPRGWMAIKAGLYDLVLAVGVEQMGKPACSAARRRRASRRKACSAPAPCRRCSPRRAWSTPASTAPPSSSSPRCR